MQPLFVREGNDNVEGLSVDIFVKKMKIRCCIAYACQEWHLKERKEEFWNNLDEDVMEAGQSDAGFILHFDGNLWAGSEIIPGDPRPQNRNGKMLQEFLNRHPHLTVINSLPLCEGLITRRRKCKDIIEESVLDLCAIGCFLMSPKW